MILLRDIALSPQAAEALQAMQKTVDDAGDYAARTTEAKRLFELRNRRGNATFDEVKRTLDRMCSGARRCAYCEDSAADEVEHVRPKALYPELAFVWRNYVYACGPCNGPKASRFAVFVDGQANPVDVARKAGASISPPRGGEMVLIDPRVEDATRFLWLDLRDTHWLVPLFTRGTREHARAAYTIETLGLNRDAVTRARHEAHADYVGRMRHYQHERDEGAPATRLEELRDGIRRRQHPTVWREMQRQHERLPRLQELFAAVPEAKSW